MRTIAVEEHFIPNEYIDYLRSRTDYPRREIYHDEKMQKCERIWYSAACCFTMTNPDAVNSIITDMGGGRIKELDKSGISMQVLSLTAPGVETLEALDGQSWAKRINDELSKTIETYPDRFIGLASLPLQEPAAAVNEFERAVKEKGLKGAIINSNVHGEYLDDKKYWVVFEKAEKLGVPIYLHPKEPSPDMLKPFTPYPTLWAALWGYGAEAGLHVMRLICSGVFDAFPRLKIILGHMGEAFPFWMWRIDRHWPYTPMAKKLSKNPSEYIKRNLLVTTSGMFFQPALLCAYLALGADNILFAVDYPYESNEAAIQFMESAPLCERDKEKIAHLNAEKLFSL